jgi:hypothetical protein
LFALCREVSFEVEELWGDAEACGVASPGSLLACPELPLPLFRPSSATSDWVVSTYIKKENPIISDFITIL